MAEKNHLTIQRSMEWRRCLAEHDLAHKWDQDRQIYWRQQSTQMRTRLTDIFKSMISWWLEIYSRPNPLALCTLYSRRSNRSTPDEAVDLQFECWSKLDKADELMNSTIEKVVDPFGFTRSDWAITSTVDSIDDSIWQALKGRMIWLWWQRHGLK